MKGLALRSTWVERLVFAYCAAMIVMQAVRGDWSHAATYLLAAVCLLTSAVWRIAALDAEPAKPRPMPASEVVAGHTGNVRVVPQAVLDESEAWLGEPLTPWQRDTLRSGLAASRTRQERTDMDAS